MAGDDLSADEAWRTIRTCRWSLGVEAFARFRYGDGFSHSRALGFQLCLAFIPLVIASAVWLAPSTRSGWGKWSDSRFSRSRRARRMTWSGTR